MILTISDVSFSYRKHRRRVHVLDDLSLAVDNGEKVALLGESGSGKSTVLGLASGILVADTGIVTLAGHDLTTCSVAERAALRLRYIANVFQDFGLFAQLTAEQNVAFALRLRGVDARQASERAREALSSVGIGKRIEHLPSELSGGEQQRVAIARALVTEPTLVLADEPTGSLDADRRDEILDLMFDALADAAFVLVTHDPRVADRASRVISMSGSGG